MSVWLDPRKQHGEECAFEAERAEIAGDLGRAKDLYRDAARSYQSLALALTSADRDARSLIGTSGVACFARAGNFGDALDLAHRLLAQPGALTERGQRELTKMASSYVELLVAERKGIKRARSANHARDDVRATFALKDVA
ncbi:MAG: hypothetical protein IPL61_22545 [Myxococcales bacterium]|nr:hypothetical protein [Myxococcales bacterium]